MSKEQFSESELAGLSEEERSALAEPEEPAATSAAGEDDPSFGADVPAAPADVAKPAATAEPAAPAAPAAAVDAAPAAPQDRDTVFTPDYRIAGPENFDAAMAGLKTERGELTAKFKEGEISVEDLITGQAEIDGRINSLREQQFAADLTATMTEQGEKQRWKLEQDTFMEDHKEYVENKILRSALNAAVVDIARREENASRSGRWVLNEAHKEVQKVMGVTKVPVPADTKLADSVTKTVVDRKPDLSLVPKTLAHLPAADQIQTGVDEFAALDKLEGVELENALSKLTPDQEARYLRASGG